MSSNLRKEADINYYFGEVKMWLDARSNDSLALLVEGKSDETLFSKLFRDNVVFFPVDGCTNAIEIISQFEFKNYPGVIAIIDADLRRILGEKNIIGKTCFLTDNHDAEMMLIDSNAIDEVINFYCIKSKKRLFEGSAGKPIKEYLLEIIKPIACCRYINETRKLGLIFKTITNGKCYFIDYNSFVDTNSLTLDLRKLLIAIENKSQKQGFLLNTRAFTDDVKTELKNKYDLLEFCNGHDFVHILSIALENVISNKRSSKKLDHIALEDALCIAYRLDEFKKTDLYTGLLAWESTSTYKIF